MQDTLDARTYKYTYIYKHTLVQILVEAAVNRLIYDRANMSITLAKNHPLQFALWLIVTPSSE